MPWRPARRRTVFSATLIRSGRRTDAVCIDGGSTTTTTSATTSTSISSSSIRLRVIWCQRLPWCARLHRSHQTMKQCWSLHMATSSQLTTDILPTVNHRSLLVLSDSLSNIRKLSDQSLLCLTYDIKSKTPKNEATKQKKTMRWINHKMIRKRAASRPPCTKKDRVQETILRQSRTGRPRTWWLGPTKRRPDTVRTPPGAVRMPPGSVEIQMLAWPSRYHQQSQVLVSLPLNAWLLELSFKKPSKMRSLMA